MSDEVMTVHGPGRVVERHLWTDVEHAHVDLADGTGRICVPASTVRPAGREGGRG